MAQFLHYYLIKDVTKITAHMNGRRRWHGWDTNMSEYPVNPNVSANPVVSAWGSFKQNEINLKNAGEKQAAAIRLMDRAGYK